MQKPKLYLFLGYPGAGKTTAARFIHEETGAEHLWTDFERHKMFGNPTHSAAENDTLYSYMNNLSSKLLSQGKSVIFDTNFNFFKDREHLRDIAAQNSAEAVVIWINTPKALSKQRAVEESQNKNTRLYGNMSASDFDRIASHLEPPESGENVVKIDGTDLDTKELLEKLHL